MMAAESPLSRNTTGLILRPKLGIVWEGAEHQFLYPCLYFHTPCKWVPEQKQTRQFYSYTPAEFFAAESYFCAVS